MTEKAVTGVLKKFWAKYDYRSDYGVEELERIRGGRPIVADWQLNFPKLKNDRATWENQHGILTRLDVFMGKRDNVGGRFIFAGKATIDGISYGAGHPEDGTVILTSPIAYLEKVGLSVGDRPPLCDYYVAKIERGGEFMIMGWDAYEATRKQLLEVHEKSYLLY